MAEPIDLQNIGGDRYCLMSRGHHDPHAFMKHVRAEGYTWPLGVPRQIYARTVPDRTGEYSHLYSFSMKPGRGSYPVTVVDEAYGADQYEALAAQAGSTGGAK